MSEMLLVLKEANEKGNKKNDFHVYREETKSRKYRTIKRKFTTGEVRMYVWPHGGTTGKSKTQVHHDLQVRQSIHCKQAKVHFENWTRIQPQHGRKRFIPGSVFALLWHGSQNLSDELKGSFIRLE